ncbi:MAG: TonB-dependent receptor [Bacteroidota bacterium]
MKNRFLKYSVLILFSLITGSTLVFGQTRTVSGNITDETDFPLPGVNIMIKGTSSGTVSDLNGEFNLEVAADDILVFSFIGYLSQEITVGNQQKIDVVLKEDVKALEEVVVIGYGTQKKSDLTGSVGVTSTSESELQTIARVEGFLQGKVAGVNVAQQSGAPGSQPKVNIRGFTGSPVYVIDGFIGEDINSINPADIESMTVLKDASATAIYGSRGANGVILIQTKKGGKSDKLNVNVDYYHSVDMLAKKMDVLSAVSYMKVINAKAEEGGALPLFSDSEIDSIRTIYGEDGKVTDWQDESFRMAHTNNLQLSISRGGEKTSYRFSLGGHQQQGIIINGDYQRYNARFNMKTSLSKTTTLDFSISNSFEKLYNVGNRGSANYGVVESAVSWPSNLPVIDPATNDYMAYQGYGPTTKGNPIFLAKERPSHNSNNNFAGKISLEQEFLKDFKLKLFGAAQIFNGSGMSFTRVSPASQTGHSSSNYSTSLRNKFQGSIQLSYNKEFNEQNRLDAVIVSEGLISRRNSYSFQALNPFTDQLGIYSAQIAESYPSGNAGFSPEGMISYLGRAVYSLKNKYLFTASFRIDGSSRLTEGNKYQPFLSGAIAYRLSDEDFIKNISAINDLKLRLSYGETGNVNSVGAYQVMDLVNLGTSYYQFEGNAVPGTRFEDGSNRANPDLIWETSRQFNAGMDLSLLGNMFSLTADYYIKYTYDSHFKKDIPSYLGGGSIISNLGVFRNNGVELQLNTKWVEGNKRKLSINTSLSFTYNVSKVITIPNDSLRVGSNQQGFDTNSHLMIIGQPVGQIVGYEYLGVKHAGIDVEGALPSAQPGDALYRDVNGDGQLNLDDVAILGNGHPDFTWGFNTNVELGSFSLNLFLRGVHGLEVYNLPAHYMLGGGSGVVDGTSTRLANSYTFNRSGDLPKLTADFRRQSSLFLEDGSFVRLDNVSLAYSLPKDKLKNANLSVYFSVQNIYAFTSYTGFDPETKSGSNTAPGVDKGSFPNPRTFTLGLKLNL